MKTRRTVLKWLGVTGAATPLAAKELVDKELLSLTVRDPHKPIASAVSEVSRKAVSRAKDNSLRDAWILANKAFPDHVELQLRENASWIPALDVDIANKRSWSMAVKIQHQRQRNYERAKREMKESIKVRAARIAWEKLSGFRWRTGLPVFCEGDDE